MSVADAADAADDSDEVAGSDSSDSDDSEPRFESGGDEARRTPLCAYCIRPCPSLLHTLPCCKSSWYCSSDCLSSDSRRHEQYHDVPYGRPGVDWTVRTSATHGLGVFALRPLPSLYRLVVDVSLPMSLALQHPNFSLLYPRNSRASNAEKWGCNAFGDVTNPGSPSVAALSIAMINHACLPNCALSPSGDVFVIVAMRPIQENEEITFSYRDLFKPTSADAGDPDEHREGLYGRWGIDCPPSCACRDEAMLSRAAVVREALKALKLGVDRGVSDFGALAAAVAVWKKQQATIFNYLKEPPFNTAHAQKSLDLVGLAMYSYTRGEDRELLKKSLELQVKMSYPNDPTILKNAASIAPGFNIYAQIPKEPDARLQERQQANKPYYQQNYWLKRYDTGKEGEMDDEYEWLAGWSQMQPTIEPLLPLKGARGLNVGVGNSPFSNDMYLAGYTNAVNIDYAENVVLQQATRYPNQDWRVMDATNMTFGNAEFDYIVDKYCLATLLCAGVVEGRRLCLKIASEYYRVLRPGGRVILMSGESAVTEYALGKNGDRLFVESSCKIRIEETGKCHWPDEDVRHICFSCVVFDKLDGLEIERKRLINKQHPISFVNALTYEELEQILKVKLLPPTPLAASNLFTDNSA